MYKMHLYRKAFTNFIFFYLIGITCFNLVLFKFDAVEVFLATLPAFIALVIPLYFLFKQVEISSQENVGKVRILSILVFVSFVSAFGIYIGEMIIVFFTFPGLLFYAFGYGILYNIPCMIIGSILSGIVGNIFILKNPRIVDNVSSIST